MAVTHSEISSILDTPSSESRIEPTMLDLSQWALSSEEMYLGSLKLISFILNELDSLLLTCKLNNANKTFKVLTSFNL